MPNHRGDGGQGGQHEHVAPGHTVAGLDHDVAEVLHTLPGDLVAGLGDDLTGVVDDVVGEGDLRAAVHAGEDGVHGEGEELAEDDHHLVHGHQGAADALGGRLTEEDGDDRRGTADGEAQHDPEEVEDPDVGRDRAAPVPR